MLPVRNPDRVAHAFHRLDCHLAGPLGPFEQNVADRRRIGKQSRAREEG